MAKKMLINADMLLATPRRNESIAQSVEIAPVIEEKEKIETPSIQQESSPTVSNNAPLVKTPTLSEVRAESQISQRNREINRVIEINPVQVSSVQKGLKPGETRATFIVKEDALEKIKAIAYWDRQNIKDIVQMAIDAYIKQYENTKGAVQPIP
jgi:hypothetical protein